MPRKAFFFTKIQQGNLLHLVDNSGRVPLVHQRIIESAGSVKVATWRVMNLCSGIMLMNAVINCAATMMCFPVDQNQLNKILLVFP